MARFFRIIGLALVVAATSLATDALNEYIHHIGSAVFAVPPGLRPRPALRRRPVRLDE